jgi:ABC-2 type transport system permease protein
VATREAEYQTSESQRFNPFERMGEVFRRREVIGNLTGKEMKVRYKSTVLGVLWSMLNPLLYLIVFYLVFKFFLPSGIPNFAVFLLSGLLGYTMFASGLQAATGSVVDNAALVSKVAFPREILPIAAVGGALVNFLYQFVVLLAFMLVTGWDFIGWNLLLLPAGLFVLLLITIAFGMGTAALNVRYRDTGHLIDLSLVAWFWVTPIVYAPALVLERLGGIAEKLYLANPLTAVTLAFQRGLYGNRFICPTGSEALPGRLVPEECTPVLPDPGLAWYYQRLAYVAVAAVAVLLLSWWAFFRLSGDFAEEL